MPFPLHYSVINWQCRAYCLYDYLNILPRCQLQLYTPFGNLMIWCLNCSYVIWHLIFSLSYMNKCWFPTGGQGEARADLQILDSIWHWAMVNIFSKFCQTKTVKLMVWLADLGEARGCSTNTFVIHSLIDSVGQRFPPTALRRRHTQTVRDRASSYKID